MNKFIFSGNLTADPELSYNGEGKPRANFTVAVTREYDRDKTDFFRCTLFSKQAEALSQYQRKGNKILCEARVQIDKKGDNFYTNVIVNSVEFLDRKGDKPQQSNQQDNADPFAGQGQEISDDSLPF